MALANLKTAYYLPKSCLLLPLTPTRKSTFCEYKGRATYYSISLPDEETQVSDSSWTPKFEVVKDRIWSYENPTKEYMQLKGYVSFYAGPWECYVDGEEVKPQPGDFYGGWMTEELEGIIKGDAATRHL